jgi:hypothetical protein
VKLKENELIMKDGATKPIKKKPQRSSDSADKSSSFEKKPLKRPRTDAWPIKSKEAGEGKNGNDKKEFTAQKRPKADGQDNFNSGFFIIFNSVFLNKIS